MLVKRLLRSFLYLVAWIFLLLVVIGNVSNRPVVRQTYFLKMDLSNIVPLSVGSDVLVNSIARSIGLHDFYQVGLWGFCEGYDDTGITHCSKPESLYAFNPVQIILNELLSGATIALPANITDALKIAKTASYWMFGLFLTTVVLSFVLIFLSPFAVSSRSPRKPQDTSRPPHRRGIFILFRSLPFTIISFMNALMTIAASVVATAMFSIFKNVFDGTSEVNIVATLGPRMMAFMWIASAFNLFAFILEFGSFCALCCCCSCYGRKKRRSFRSGMGEKNGPGSPSDDSTLK